jgi:hypothetical protein
MRTLVSYIHLVFHSPNWMVCLEYSQNVYDSLASIFQFYKDLFFLEEGLAVLFHT